MHLNSAHQQCKDDEATASEECKSLAQEVEVLLDGVMAGISDHLDVYASCKGDKVLYKLIFLYKNGVINSIQSD